LQQRNETLGLLGETSPREMTRNKLADAAHRLFMARGFHAVTVDEIAKEAGLSRRTFFRHFATKESVVFPDDDKNMRFFRLALAQETGGRPATMDHLRAVQSLMAAVLMANAELIGQRRAFIDQSASLIAHEEMIFLEWRRALAEGIDGILHQVDAGDQVAPSSNALIVAGAIVGALKPTFEAWYSSGQKIDLAEAGDQVLARLEHGFGRELRPS